MNGVDAVLDRHRDDRLDVQVRTDRFAAARRSDQERFVGLETVQRKPIFVAVDRDRPEAELGCRPEAADGDLRAVGDEQFAHSGTG
jgi:hypothetical protein